MFDVKDTLLPPTATPLAKALDILEDRLFGLPVQMISKDPATVDVGWLDHLAWEYSVDVWDAGWPEGVKRRVIAAAAEVHRHKGTPHAVKLALAAFGYPAELSEWWEHSGTRGTFRVGLDLGEVSGAVVGLLSESSRSKISRAVRGAAPVSRLARVDARSSRVLGASVARFAQVATVTHVGVSVSFGVGAFALSRGCAVYRARKTVISPAVLSVGSIRGGLSLAGVVRSAVKLKITKGEA